MARRKIQRITEVRTLPNVLYEKNSLKGKWQQAHFKNSNPITLELGCGKSEFSIELALRFPERNFIAVDYRSYILWTGAKAALKKGISNISFLNIFIQNITEYFAEDEIDEIWFIFPDPFPKARHTKHRLLHSNFLELYKKILKKEGIIHLKTDSQDLFDYTKEVLSTEKININNEFKYSDYSNDDIIKIQTTFERKFLKVHGSIKYLNFSFT